MKKILTALFVILFSAQLAVAQSVEVRFLTGKPFGSASEAAPENVTVKKYRLKKTDDGLRLTIPKEDISDKVWGVEVVPGFMKAEKGDEGYWMSGRGVYGLYDKEEGSFYKQRSVTPVYAMKKGDVLWYGHVKKWRFDYNYIVRAVAGKYESVLRFRADRVRAFFDLYDDIVIDYRSLKGDEADYNGLAKIYREYQMEHNGVRTVKDRVKDFPQLEYLSESFIVRIQTHAAKHIATEIPKEKADFTPETEYPLEVHMPFGVSEEFMQAIKDAGVDKATFVSAGWNYGGYDGRTPQHFPVEPSIGGEEGLYVRLRNAADTEVTYTITIQYTKAIIEQEPVVMKGWTIKGETADGVSVTDETYDVNPGFRAWNLTLPHNTYAQYNTKITDLKDASFVWDIGEYNTDNYTSTFAFVLNPDAPWDVKEPGKDLREFKLVIMDEDSAIRILLPTGKVVQGQNNANPTIGVLPPVTTIEGQGGYTFGIVEKGGHYYLAICGVLFDGAQVGESLEPYVRMDEYVEKGAYFRVYSRNGEYIL